MHVAHFPVYLGLMSYLIVWGQPICQERVESDKIQTEKNLAHRGTQTRNLEICGSMLYQAKTEVPRDVRNSKVQKQDKFRRYWSQH